MRTASPWWASLVYALGLVLLFTGERAFSDHDTVHLLASGLGTLLVVGVTAARAWTMLSSRGARRKVEAVLLLCHLVAGVALVIYAFTTKTGMGWLGYDDLTTKAAQHTRTMLLVVWLILVALALIPLFMIEVSLGAADRTWFDRGARTAQAVDDEAVELVRVKQIALSGVTIALAAALVVVCYDVAGDHNVRRDVSWFKTAAPGESTINIVKNTAKPIRVLLFFPEVNEVGDQVKDYFEDLSRATGGKLTVEAHDREAEPRLANHYHVQKDGTILFTNATPEDDKVDKPDKPPKTVQIAIDTDMQKARLKTGKLRTLDREVNTQLLALMREKLKVYLTVGHGEMNDPESVIPELRGTTPLRGVSMLRRVLGLDQYEIANLGAFQLASGVPDDASVVMVLGPAQPLRPEEYEALDKYVAKGGHLLIALDPRGTSELGPLAGRLGVQMKKGILADDKVFVDQHHGAADHRFTITTQFSAHAATTTLSRAAANMGVLLIEAGALEDHDFTGAAGGEQPKKTYVIHSMPTAWLDLDGNFQLDDNEKRDRYNIAAAIEGPKVTGDDGKEKDGWKALVFSDADLFADYPPGRPAIDLTSGPLIEDSTKWLAGEANLSGEIKSEDDVPIKHTRSKDQVWFYLTVIGVPLVVLALGLLITLPRGRRRTARKSEVAS